MLLSIIIPCYNGEKYITYCIESIETEIARCAQIGIDVDSFEIIAINDGSTDKTQSLLESLSHNYPNIRVVNQQNKGLSQTRNIGLDLAKGDYVHFMDCDDLLFEGSYTHLIKEYLLPNRPDVLKFSSVTVDRKTKKRIDSYSNNETNRALYHGDMLGFVNQYGFLTFAWSQFYSRRMLLESGVKFKDLSPCEDFVYNVELALACQNTQILSCNLNVYKYMLHEGSLVTNYSSKSIHRAVESYMSAWNIMEKFSTPPYIRNLVLI
jgi:glycosyltransferase involved in cell wall biosynthesis